MTSYNRTNTNGSKVEAEQPHVSELVDRILGQYHDLLLDHAEREVKSITLHKVAERSSLPHHQARESLRSAEIKALTRLHDALEQARGKMSALFLNEVSPVFADLSEQLGVILGDSPIAHSSATGSPEESRPTYSHSHEYENLPQPPSGGSGDHELSVAPDTHGTTAVLERVTPVEEVPETPVTSEPGAAREETDAASASQHQEVCLQLPAPVQLKPMMEFYSALAGHNEVRVVQTLGSVDKGMSLFVRPKPQCASLPGLLRTLPGVQTVEDRPVSRVDGLQTMGIMLAPGMGS